MIDVTQKKFFEWFPLDFFFNFYSTPCESSSFQAHFILVTAHFFRRESNLSWWDRILAWNHMTTLTPLLHATVVFIKGKLQIGILFPLAGAAIMRSLIFYIGFRPHYGCLSATYISSLSFDARKKIIGALDRVIPCQEYFLFKVRLAK